MSRRAAGGTDPKPKQGKRRIRPLLLVLLWVWAFCVFLVVDLFRNVEEFDSLRPESRLYRGMQRAAHDLIDAPFDEREALDRGVKRAEGPEETRRLQRPIPLQRDWHWLDHGTQAQRADPKGEAQGELRDGKREGRWTWTRADGSLREERHYREGRLHGQTASNYEDGTRESEEHYEEGVPHGRWMQWYADSEKALEETYRRGVLHGDARRWHPNGQLAAEAHFEDGEPVGKLTIWHANGRKAQEGEFRDGERWGRWQSWDKSGKLVEDQMYHEGKKVD